MRRRFVTLVERVTAEKKVWIAINKATVVFSAA
jgi:hypothetical protein